MYVYVYTISSYIFLRTVIKLNDWDPQLKFKWSVWTALRAFLEFRGLVWVYRMRILRTNVASSFYGAYKFVQLSEIVANLCSKCWSAVKGNIRCFRLCCGCRKWEILCFVTAALWENVSVAVARSCFVFRVYYYECFYHNIHVFISAYVCIFVSLSTHICIKLLLWCNW